MSEHQPLGSAGVGYEKKDINVRKVFFFGLLLVALIGAVGIGTTVLVFKGTENKNPDASLSPLLEPQHRPPAPRLQAYPQQDLKQLRADEAKVLASYGWVDRANGVVRIPVDRAIDLIVEQGLPPKPEAGAKSIPGAVPARSPK
jgi:hypothetical protein